MLNRKFYEVSEPDGDGADEEVPIMFSHFVYQGERFWSPEECRYVEPQIIERLWPYMEEIDEMVYRSCWEGLPYGCMFPSSPQDDNPRADRN